MCFLAVRWNSGRLMGQFLSQYRWMRTWLYQVIRNLPRRLDRTLPCFKIGFPLCSPQRAGWVLFPYFFLPRNDITLTGNENLAHHMKIELLVSFSSDCWANQMLLLLCFWVFADLSQVPSSAYSPENSHICIGCLFLRVFRYLCIHCIVIGPNHAPLPLIPMQLTICGCLHRICL